MPKGSDGRVALITGAAGAFGRCFAARLASDGFDLVLSDTEPCTDAQTRATAHGRTVLDHSCDLGDPAAVGGLAAAALERFGTIDVLVNNAAIQMITPFADVSLEMFRLTQRVNVEAPMLLAQALAPAMIAQGWGRIVNIASRTPWQPAPGFLPYITSKLGLVGFTRALAHELGAFGITANAVAPGLTPHPGNEAALSGEMKERARLRQAIKRMPEPEDVAGVVAFLASEDSRFVTGQTISADGGSMIL